MLLHRHFKNLLDLIASFLYSYIIATVCGGASYEVLAWTTAPVVPRLLVPICSALHRVGCPCLGTWLYQLLEQFSRGVYDLPFVSKHTHTSLPPSRIPTFPSTAPWGTFCFSQVVCICEAREGTEREPRHPLAHCGNGVNGGEQRKRVKVLGKGYLGVRMPAGSLWHINS